MSASTILDDLRRADIAFALFEHEPVLTVQASDAIHAALPGVHTKNLFLKGKDGTFWLVVMPHDRRADLKALAGVLGAGKLSFAKEEAMWELLEVRPGAVNPLALANAPSSVRLAIDAAILSAGSLTIHPMRNTASINLALGDLFAFLAIDAEEVVRC